MTTEYLVLANVLLLTRLSVLFKDAAPGRAWAAKAGVELAALAALYEFSPAGGGAAMLIAVGNLVGWRSERWGRHKNLARLLLGLATLGLLGFCFPPGGGLGLRPELGRWGVRLADWTPLAPLAFVIAGHAAQIFLFGLLLAANEANLAIRAVFDRLDLKPRSQPAGGGVVDVGEFNRGRVIGILERALLYLFLLQGQYGAIGFVLAAKAFTRFKALDDRAFAEYVLIGTLLSACCALVIAAAVQAS